MEGRLWPWVRASAGCGLEERAGGACGSWAGTGQGPCPLGCSPMVPQPEMQSRSGDSSQGQLAAAGRQVPPSVRRSRLRMPSQWLGSGSASVRGSMAQADTKGNSRDEKRLSSEVEGLRTRLLTWCFPTWLFSQQPKPRLCGCAAPELPLSLGS